VEIRIVKPPGVQHAGVGVADHGQAQPGLHRVEKAVRPRRPLHRQGVHGAEGVPQQGALVLRGLGIGAHPPDKLVREQLHIKPDGGVGVIAALHHVARAQWGYHVPGGIERVPAVYPRALGRPALEDGGALVRGKAGELPGHLSQVLPGYAAQQLPRPIRPLPHHRRVKKAGQGLRLLLRDEDHDIPASDQLLGQVQHDRGAQGRVHPEIHHRIAGQLPLHQGAVHPEGHAAAPHQDNAGAGGLVQIPDLVFQLAHKGVPVLGGEEEPPAQQHGGEHQQRQSGGQPGQKVFFHIRT
jgi:hypothetical protein